MEWKSLTIFLVIFYFSQEIIAENKCQNCPPVLKDQSGYKQIKLPFSDSAMDKNKIISASILRDGLNSNIKDNRQGGGLLGLLNLEVNSDSAQKQTFHQSNSNPAVLIKQVSKSMRMSPGENVANLAKDYNVIQKNNYVSANKGESNDQQRVSVQGDSLLTSVLGSILEGEEKGSKTIKLDGGDGKPQLLSLPLGNEPISLVNNKLRGDMLTNFDKYKSFGFKDFKSGYVMKTLKDGTQIEQINISPERSFESDVKKFMIFPSQTPSNIFSKFDEGYAMKPSFGLAEFGKLAHINDNIKTSVIHMKGPANNEVLILRNMDEEKLPRNNLIVKKIDIKNEFINDGEKQEMFVTKQVVHHVGIGKEGLVHDDLHKEVVSDAKKHVSNVGKVEKVILEERNVFKPQIDVTGSSKIVKSMKGSSIGGIILKEREPLAASVKTEVRESVIHEGTTNDLESRNIKMSKNVVTQGGQEFVKKMQSAVLNKGSVVDTLVTSKNTKAIVNEVNKKVSFGSLSGSLVNKASDSTPLKPIVVPFTSSKNVGIFNKEGTVGLPFRSLSDSLVSKTSERVLKPNIVTIPPLFASSKKNVGILNRKETVDSFPPPFVPQKNLDILNQKGRVDSIPPSFAVQKNLDTLNRKGRVDIITPPFAPQKNLDNLIRKGRVDSIPPLLAPQKSLDILSNKKRLDSIPLKNAGVFNKEARLVSIDSRKPEKQGTVINKSQNIELISSKPKHYLQVERIEHFNDKDTHTIGLIKEAEKLLESVNMNTKNGVYTYGIVRKEPLMMSKKEGIVMEKTEPNTNIVIIKGTNEGDFGAKQQLTEEKHKSENEKLPLSKMKSFVLPTEVKYSVGSKLLHEIVKHPKEGLGNIKHTNEFGNIARKAEVLTKYFEDSTGNIDQKNKVNHLYGWNGFIGDRKPGRVRKTVTIVVRSEESMLKNGGNILSGGGKIMNTAGTGYHNEYSESLNSDNKGYDTSYLMSNIKYLHSHREILRYLASVLLKKKNARVSLRVVKPTYKISVDYCNKAKNLERKCPHHCSKSQNYLKDSDRFLRKSLSENRLAMGHLRKASFLKDASKKLTFEAKKNQELACQGDSAISSINAEIELYKKIIESFGKRMKSNINSIRVLKEREKILSTKANYYKEAALSVKKSTEFQMSNYKRLKNLSDDHYRKYTEALSIIQQENLRRNLLLEKYEDLHKIIKKSTALLRDIFKKREPAL
ncbi:uncharacterized protein [Periplaneta americana]|uniref:uncharacterized protein isoform X1 n=1 Tax=Periplaneta americana TaxID=6978 RepID=UPI0037E701F5